VKTRHQRELKIAYTGEKLPRRSHAPAPAAAGKRRNLKYEEVKAK
jgi:hypothetical protein